MYKIYNFGGKYVERKIFVLILGLSGECTHYLRKCAGRRGWSAAGNPVRGGASGHRADDALFLPEKVCTTPPTGRATICATPPRKLAGLTKFGNVTLRWGVSDDSDFLEWVYSVAPTNTAPPTAWCGMLEGCRFLPAASAPA